MKALDPASISRTFGWASALALLFHAGVARAEGPYAKPPGSYAGNTYADGCREGEDCRPRLCDGCGEPYRPLRRSGVRLALGPSSVTTGVGLGYGLFAGVDLGTGSIGARVSGTWARAERGDGTSPTGNGFAQYLVELVLDPRKEGALHPVFAVGLGAATIRGKDETSAASIGTARVGVEYALGLEDADVRVGANIFGAMAGPAEPALKDLRGYGGLQLQVSVGF